MMTQQPGQARSSGCLYGLRGLDQVEQVDHHQTRKHPLTTLTSLNSTLFFWSVNLHRRGQGQGLEF